MKSLTNKSALITGGSRGIGFDIADLFASEGADVLITYRSEATGAEAVNKLRAKYPGQKIEGRVCDVANSGEVEKLFTEVVSLFGGLYVLVNNAGITRDNLVLRMKEEEWDAVLDTNLKGAFLIAKSAAKLMLKARTGRIINISSVVGETGNAGQVNYAASKGGLLAMTKSMARELASRNILVNSITPGYIETEMTHGLSDEIKKGLMDQIPLGKLGKGSDIAQGALFLASEGSSYMTGQTLAINGGMSMI
jgi:3-oxoacyl-[acyl-carrier protein] reductase